MARLTRQEKIVSIEDEIAALLASKKQLLKEQAEADRKARTNRLCKRAGYIESVLADTIHLTDKRFNEFVDKTLRTAFARKVLDELLLEQEIEAEDAIAATATAAPVESSPETSKTASTAPNIPDGVSVQKPDKPAK
jgi:hypothetical protein